MGPEGRKMRVRRGRDVRKGWKRLSNMSLKYDLPLKKKLFYKVSVDNFFTTYTLMNTPGVH